MIMILNDVPMIRTSFSMVKMMNESSKRHSKLLSLVFNLNCFQIFG